MPDDHPSEEFPRVCRLFPLSGVVLFPHAVLPLHIFEPRYRQMTEDALGEGDKMIALVQLSGVAGEGIGDDPPMEPVACLGRIVQHQRLHDGRFDFLLLGLKRVRLIREVASDRLYRMAEVEILEDQEPQPYDDPRRAELLALFRQAAGGNHPLDPELETLLNSSLPLGLLTDLLAHAMGIPSSTKQALLAETCVARRAETLVQILGQAVSRGPDAKREGPGFPPSFSVN